MEIKSLLYVENYNTGFPAYVADVIIHLSQWQFWFWFWFSVFWILFILVIFKIFYYQNTKNNNIINTSLRSHGKWGDFLAAILPLTWCSGILINSNFILRTLEWQHENTLFTLRIHGRQWYWIFKYDMKTFLDIFNYKIRIGKNFLFLTNFNIKNKNIIKTLKPYYSFFFLKNTKIYLKKILNKHWSNIHIPYFMQSKDWTDLYLPTLCNRTKKLNIKKFNFFNFYLSNDFYNIPRGVKKSSFKKFSGVEAFDNTWDVKWCLRKNFIKTYIESGIYFKKFNNKYLLNLNVSNIARLNKKFTFYYIKSIFEESFMLIKKNSRLFYFFLNTHNTDNLNSKISYKSIESRLFYILKQKRSKKLNYSRINKAIDYDKLILFNNCVEKIKKAKIIPTPADEAFANFCIYEEIVPTKKPYSFNEFISNIILNIEKCVSLKKKFKNTSYLIQKCKAKKKQNKRTFTFSLSLSKRLLKVKKVLLLPVATNIALVTSSYDVAHSLFIPALGLKFDAVPGRATHHTLNIIHRGVYYAQCAEICGRYHHHMPAKIGVVFFEQFINWWKLKSLNVFIKINKNIILNNFHILNYYFTKLYSY